MIEDITKNTLEIWNNIITLAIIDANGFKEINDHFGHAAGDEALKNFLRPLKIALER